MPSMLMLVLPTLGLHMMMRPMCTEAPTRARCQTATMTSQEEAAKQAWLARLDAPTWSKAATTVAGISATALSTPDGMEEDCIAGIETACDMIAHEEAAKQAWLAKLDAPTWGAVAAAVTEVAAAVNVESGQPGEEQAKKAWLSRLDAPTWGAAASTLVEVAGDAVNTEALTEACDSGENVACDMLNQEADAKAKWLAMLDAPVWGAAAAAVAAVATVASEVPADSGATAEEIAWRKQQGVAPPTAAAPPPPTTPPPAAASPPIAPTSAVGGTTTDVSAGTMPREEFMAFQYPHVDLSEDELRALGLQPVGGEMSSSPHVMPSPPPAPPPAPAAVDIVVGGDIVANPSPQPMPAPPMPAPPMPAPTPAAGRPSRSANWDAKRLAGGTGSHDSWHHARAEVWPWYKKALQQDCNTGIDIACEMLNREAETKAQWEAKLAAPGGEFAEAAPQYRTPPRPSANAAVREQAAKRAWLAKLETQSRGGGGRGGARRSTAAPGRSGFGTPLETFTTKRVQKADSQATGRPDGWHLGRENMWPWYKQ